MGKYIVVYTIAYFLYSRPSKMPLWKLMPDRVVENGEEHNIRSQPKAFLWSIVFLFFFTCSIVLIFAIIQKVNPDSILLHKGKLPTGPRNSSISATNYNLEMNVTSI